MKLVVDANILIAAFLKDAATREFFIPLWSNDLALKEQSAVTVLATGELIKLLK